LAAETVAPALMFKKSRNGEKGTGLIRWPLKNHEKLKKIW
jgi:hypothetical protein